MSWSSLLYKSVTFSLHPNSQPLFAFEDPTNPSQQLTWTVLPQGFEDSPHLFGPALTRDLLCWHYSAATLLQYVEPQSPSSAGWLSLFKKLSGLPGIGDTKCLRRRLNYTSHRSPIQVWSWRGRLTPLSTSAPGDLTNFQIPAGHPH
jgi:hypothetical protein